MPNKVKLTNKYTKQKAPELNLGTPNAKQIEFFKSKTLYTAYGGARGGGKAIPDTELVCTPFGFKPMGDIKQWDVVTAQDGGPTRVLAVWPQGLKECYRLTFVDGSTCEAAEDHLWTVKRTCHRSKREGQWTVRTTKMLYDAMDSKNSHWLIPLCEPIKFNRTYRNGYPVKPYTLGALIGDGSLTGKTVALTTEDAEMIERIREDGYDVNQYSNPLAFGFRRFKDEYDWIKKVGLNKTAEHKFVPEQYKFAPLDIRMELIRGLMDTDGSADDRGHCEFCSISKQLAEDVKWLIGSIGGKATISEKQPVCTMPDGTKVDGKIAYRVYIQTRDNSELFSLERKKARCRGKKFNGGVSELNRRIIKIEPIGQRQCTCIAVDRPDGLFVIKDFVVTHNSWAVRTKAVGGALTWPGIRILIIRRTYPELQQNHIEPIIKMVPSSVGSYNGSLKTMYFKNGSYIKFGHAQSLTSIETEYQGQEYDWIFLDEATQFAEQEFRTLGGCLRGVNNIPKRFYLTCNPGKHSCPAVQECAA